MKNYGKPDTEFTSTGQLLQTAPRKKKEKRNPACRGWGGAESACALAESSEKTGGMLTAHLRAQAWDREIYNRKTGPADPKDWTEHIQHGCLSSKGFNANKFIVLDLSLRLW